MSENKIRNAVANVLVNASNYPDGVQHHVLGRDMTPLIDKVTEAAADGLAKHIEKHRELRTANDVIDWLKNG